MFDLPLLMKTFCYRQFLQLCANLDILVLVRYQFTALNDNVADSNLNCANYENDHWPPTSSNKARDLCTCILPEKSTSFCSGVPSSIKRHQKSKHWIKGPSETSIYWPSVSSPFKGSFTSKAGCYFTLRRCTAVKRFQ